MTLIRVSLLRQGVLRQGDIALLDEWDRESEDRVWVDIEAPEQEVIEPLLEERLGFHELAAEDTLSPNTLPKYDSFSTYDFFIFRTVDVNVSDHQSETYKIAAFLGKNFLFTVHRRPLRAISHEITGARSQMNTRFGLILEPGTGYIRGSGNTSVRIHDLAAFAVSSA